MARQSWLRALPPLALPVARTMPWGTLLAGCLAGIGYLAVVAGVGGSQPLDQGTVRLAFLPAVAAVAFVARTPFRSLARTTPVPAWVVPAGHLLLAVPVVAATYWTLLRIAGHIPVGYPLSAQLVGWCAVAIAAAACVDRSRYADLGGAVAAPVGFAVIALAWYAPGISGFLTDPPASARGVTIAWYAVASAAAILTCAAMRDQWHRYSSASLSWASQSCVRRRRPEETIS